MIFPGFPTRDTYNRDTEVMKRSICPRREIAVLGMCQPQIPHTAWSRTTTQQSLKDRFLTYGGFRGTFDLRKYVTADNAHVLG